MPAPGIRRLPDIIALSDGIRTSKDIASVVGLDPRYVRRLMLRYNLPQRTRGAGLGTLNHQFVAGRRIDLSGYVLITVPSNHPYARQRTHGKTKLMYEHRHVMEKKLDRYLLPEEVVDHEDGLTLHNAPDNLKLYAKNSDHLRGTLTGYAPHWSLSGRKNIRERLDPPPDRILVDTYRRRKESGDVRLRQILLLALKLGTDSPFLSGTTRHIEKAQIDMSSRSTIERALADLYERWEADLAR